MSASAPTAAARRLILAVILLAGLTLVAGTARAQQQDSKLLDRIMHPDMDLHFDGFERSFDTKASGRNKQANVRAFAFGSRTAGVRGDGAFHSRAFNDGRGSFTTGNFAVKQATAVDRQALPQADRTFATRSVDVREDRVANKSANTRQFVNADKPFLVPGRRQDDIDELRRQKNLSSDQIREILNKNH